MYRPQVAVPASIAFITIDIATTIFALAFYHQGFYFDTQQLSTNLLLKNGYNWYASPIDFVILTVIRSIALGIGLILYLNGKIVKGTRNIVFTLNYLPWCYGIVKFLGMSDDEQMHLTFGLYYSVIWNMIGFTVVSLIWCYGLHCVKVPGFVESFVNYADNVWPWLVRLVPSHNETELLINEEEEESKKEVLEKDSTWQTTKHLIAFCNHHAFWFFSSFVYSIICAIAFVSIPYFTGNLISELVQGGGADVIIKYVFIIGGLSVTGSIFGGIRWGASEWATALIHRKMRSDLFKSLIYQEMAFYDENQTGEITSRLTSDVEKMAGVMSTNTNIFLKSNLMLAGSVIFMFIMSWKLTLICIMIIPLMGYVTTVYGASYDTLGEKDQDTIANANTKAEEILSSMKTVKSFASESREVQEFEHFLDKTMIVKKQRAFADMTYSLLTEMCQNAILVIVLAYGGHLCLTKRMTPEDLIKYLLYQIQLGQYMFDLGWIFANIMNAVGSSRKVFEYISRLPKVPKTGTEQPIIEGKVEFKNVKFSYSSRPDQIVLNNLSLEAESGTIVALVGKSGAGKSSIISLLERFYLPTEGEILLDGKNIDLYENDYYHKKIVLVSQNPVLFAGTVRQNILYGCVGASDEDMIKAAKLANAHDFIMEQTLGYDSICGEKGCLFSGGQIQRLCIARVLVLKPKVILLDESTSALDTESERIVQDAIYKNLKDKTVFVIAHRLSTIEKATKIYVINKGQVEQVGNHQELMSETEGMYYSLVQKQKLTTKETDIIKLADLITENVLPSSPVSTQR